MSVFDDVVQAVTHEAIDAGEVSAEAPEAEQTEAAT
jgi:hypothetical protein